MSDSHVDPQHLAGSAYQDAGKLDRRNEIQEEYASHPVAWFEWVFGWLDLPPHCRILELGSGSGVLWQKNRPKISPGWSVVLSDRAPAMAAAARENLADLETGRAITVVDGQDLPFPDESFDAVLAIGVLDHLPDVQRALGEIWRALRPSGLFLASAGGSRHLDELETLLKPYLPVEQAESIGGQEDRFGLENGANLLSTFFEEVVRHDYRSTMTFSEAQPVLDYIFSETDITAAMSREQTGALVNRVKQQVSGRGEFRATIEKGLFVARKKVVK